MGVFSRFSDIINANINSVLDRAEDPQKCVRLVIQEMEETLVEIRGDIAGYLGDQKTLQRQLDQLNKHAAQWQQKAELALSKDREDLARAALIESQKADEQVQQLTRDIAKLAEILTQLQDDSGRLQQKLVEAKARHNSMAQRQTAVVTQLRVRQQNHSGDIERAMARFDGIERKIDELEAQVEAYDLTKGHLVTQEFQRMEADEKMETALAKLKAQMATKQVVNG